MKKRALILVLVLGAILLLIQLTGQALAGFQESRWEIIDLLAYPNKIDSGVTQAYSVSKASWERSDLNDGTARWLAQATNLYNYELIGSPIKTVTLMAALSSDTNQVSDLMIRAIVMMRVVGMSKEKALEAFERLVDSATKNKDKKYYVEEEGIRAEMIIYSTMSSLLLILKKS